MQPLTYSPGELAYLLAGRTNESARFAHDLGVVHGQDPDEIMPPGGVHLYQGPDDFARDALVTNHSLSNSTVGDAGRPENQRLMYGVRDDVVGR